MNTIKKFRNLFFILVGLGMVHSCVQDDEFAIPSTDIACSDAWEANMTLHELVALIDADDDGIVQFSEEKVIEGYVISDDLPGNFFKTISIQDSPTNPTIGIQVEIDQTNLGNYFPLGSKIRINLKDIYAGFDMGVYKVGETFISNGNVRVGRMRAAIMNDHVKRVCGDLVEIEPVVFESITAAKSSGILNTLVTINNVQFTDAMLGEPFAPAGTTVNRVLEDESGATIDLRNSGFADFADQLLPEGSGSVTVVLSKYQSSFQLFARDENDILFENPRFGDGNGGGSGNGSGPIGGTAAEYKACVNEGFSAFSPETTSFAPYINDAAAGTRYWEVTSFGNNQYIQMTSYNSDDASNVAYFIVPVNFSNADTFSFKTKDGYNNGNVLSVYYSTNYVLGGDIDAATLTDITSEFTISSGNTNQYGANFIESGNYDLSAINGNGVILFKYEGNSSVTTTMQIDDIQIVDNDNPDCGNDDNGGGEGNDEEAANLLFSGADFEDWNTFLGSLNTYGVTAGLAVQGVGNGRDGSNSFHLNGTTAGTNPYVFTVTAESATVPANPTKITMWVKGSAAKSLSFNLDTTDGRIFFNLGEFGSGNVTLTNQENNQYLGTVDTNGEWRLVTLDISGYTLNSTGDLLALKAGSGTAYDLIIDNIKID